MLLDTSLLGAMATGCAVLGTGGGGETHAGLLIAQQALERYGPVDLITLDDLEDDDLVVPCGMTGAPTVCTEKIVGDDVGGLLIEAVEKLSGRQAACLMPIEIGGTNGLLPLAWAARTNRPLLDADGMGRAFPEVPQAIPHLAGVKPDPMVIADDRGQVITIRNLDVDWGERLVRSIAVTFGGSCVTSEFHMDAATARTATIPGSVSLAIRIGRAILECEQNPLQSLLAAVDGTSLITAKIADVERRTVGGFVRGSLEAEGTGDDHGRLLRIEFQNENLVAIEDGRVLASTPDLITVVDAETAHPIFTESLRYGQRICVLAMPSHPRWREPDALAVAGPRAFGYEFDYVRLEDLLARPL